MPSSNLNNDSKSTSAHHVSQREAIQASFARQGFLKTQQGNTSSQTKELSLTPGDRNVAMLERAESFPKDEAPHDARMMASVAAKQDTMAKGIPASTVGGLSSEQPQGSIGSTAKHLDSLKATDDAFARFQARLMGQGNLPPAIEARLTENTRKKVSLVRDLAGSSPDRASVSTNSEVLG